MRINIKYFINLERYLVINKILLIIKKKFLLRNDNKVKNWRYAL